ncbi:MAG: VWA domain-containing protein [Kofleriaceae bacterium]
MKLAALCFVALGIPAAHATSFEEFGPGQRVREAVQLYEAACDLDIDVKGAVASVEMKQRIVNPGPQPMAAIYEHGLPAGAVVTGFAIKHGKGAVETSIAVANGFRTADVDSADVLGADPAILKKLGDGRYEVTVQPIAPDHEITLITRYAMIATPRAGALRVVIPGRSAASGKLTACKGAVKATPGPGTSVRQIRIGGKDAGRATALIAVDTLDVSIDVDTDVAGAQPVVWTQTQALADGWNASLVTVLAPRTKAAGVRRVVFVVDGSRSMDLVGRHNVGKVVKALGSALPSGAEVEAILYDRTAKRVFDEVRPANAKNLAVIEDAIAKRVAGNGSDIVAAFELAKQVITGVRGQAMVIVVTDGVTGELADQALIQALASKTSAVDVHAIVLDPARTRSPGAKLLRAPVNLYGGAYVEVNVDDLDDAMVAIDEWMRPSWLELEMTGAQIPSEIRGGAGFTKLVLHKGAPALTLTGHSDAKVTVVARPGPAAPLAVLALASAAAGDLTGQDPDATETEHGNRAFAKALAANPSAENERSLVVLSSTGRIAKDRRAMIAGGGRYERIVALADPQRVPPLPNGPAAIPATAIARITLERIFRDQLHPKAFNCYQRALGQNAKLAGTVHFQMRMGRGEVTDVQITGLGDKTLDACLVDAAYTMTPPMPDFTVNADDQTVANYPLTFNRRADQAVVVLGDADSTSPIDIDGVEGGVPKQPRRVKVNTKTPLGNMKAPKSP